MSVYNSSVFQRGFGTFPLRGDALAQAVRDALGIGYRAFDTAQWYGNEKDLGDVIASAGVPRRELLITTKVHPENMNPDRFLPSVQKSVEDLGGEVIDVLLLHWPPKDDPVEPSLELLQDAQRQGYARHVGVSNYTVAMMHKALEVLDAPPVVNQVEFHPLLNQEKLRAASLDTGIPLSSYCSIARGEIFNYPVLAEIGGRHGKSAAQVTLRWILQKGVTMNTMSTRRANMQANFDIMDFSLDEKEMRMIDGLNATNYRISNSDVVPYAPTWD